jgi:hypothetical protein
VQPSTASSFAAIATIDAIDAIADIAAITAIDAINAITALTAIDAIDTITAIDAIDAITIAAITALTLNSATPRLAPLPRLCFSTVVPAGFLFTHLRAHEPDQTQLNSAELGLSFVQPIVLCHQPPVLCCYCWLCLFTVLLGLPGELEYTVASA